MGWRYKINFTEEFKKADDGEISIAELSSIIVLKLAELKLPGDSLLQDIVRQFKSLNADSTDDDFDIILARLYDWGDERRCWIGAAF